MAETTGVRSNRRKIEKPKRNPNQIDISTGADIAAQKIMDDVLMILKDQVQKLKHKAFVDNDKFATQDFNNLHKATQTLMYISKETREVEKTNDFSGMTTDEILEQFTEAQKALESKREKEKQV